MDASPILITMKTAAVSIVFTFFLGLAAARWVTGMRRGWMRMVVDGLFTVPLVLPPMVAGFFLLHLCGVRGPVGRFFLDVFSVRIAFSWSATVLAAVAVSFPLMYRGARGALEQVDEALVFAARTLGMREGQIFWRVRLPVALPGVASGAALAFARGLGEFGATAMLAGNIAGVTRTLPLAVYAAVASGDMEKAMGYVVVLVAISLVVAAAIHLIAAWERGGRGAAR